MDKAKELMTPQLGAFADPDVEHLEVSWTDEELDELFGGLGVAAAADAASSIRMNRHPD